MILRPRKFKALEKALGHKFKSEALLERALTHSSVRGSNVRRVDNERLEFIGDRVLGLAIVELLHETHPDASEGDMARRTNALVKGETCATVARSIGLGSHLILSPSEADQGGREKENILADAIEAVLGAIFIDGGYTAARKAIRAFWIVEPGSAKQAASQDSKSALQEWAQGRGLALPKYVALERSGPDHAPVFTCEVRIPGHNPARGTGASKRAAEQAAASALLAALESKIDGRKSTAGRPPPRPSKSDRPK